MGHWNYRIVNYTDGGFGLHEVHYDEEYQPKSMTANAVRFTADSAEELRGLIMLANADAKSRPVLDENIFESEGE